MICSVLPYKEGYDRSKFAAVALTVSEQASNSCYHDKISVLGAWEASSPLSDNYQQVKVTRNLFETRNYAYLKAINNKLKGLPKPDIIEVHNRPSYVKYLTDRGFRVCLHLHNDPQEMNGSETLKKRLILLKKCEYIYVVSKYIAAKLSEDIIDQSLLEKIIVIYNLPNLQIEKKKKQQLITFIGRISSDKGADLVLNAYKRIINNYPDWQFNVVGHLKINRETKQLQNLLTKLKECKNFYHNDFLDYQSAISLFQKSAIAVLPSVWEEPFGRTVYEALSQGCATITSNRGGIPEIVGDSAITSDTPTAEFVEENIIALIQGASLRDGLQTKAIERAEQFKEQALSQETLDVCRSKFMQI